MLFRSGGESESKKLNVLYQADKTYGPTINKLRYRIDLNESDAGDTSTNSSVNFTNTTRLSRHSAFNLGITHDSFDNNTVSSDTRKSFGLTMGLTSDPSRFFRQTHNISHYRTSVADTKENVTSYAGNLNYEVTKKVKLNLTLGVSKNSTQSDTTTVDSTNTTASSSFSYSLTERLSATQVVSATFTETSSSDQSSLNLREDRKSTRLNSSHTDITRMPSSA